ncbi:MAG: hypothetical protein ACYDH3_05060 [Candidatus Aminicenantales bacterium]
MSDFLTIKSLGEAETMKIEAEIDARIAARKKEGLLSDREIREIEGMRLRPLPDILDVQVVYENHLYPKRG